MMLQPLVLALALSVGQDAKLEITQPHATYGYLGASRPPGDGALPGDVLLFTFNIKNLKLDKGGRASYSVGVEIKDTDGDVLFRQKPQNAIAQNCFGGNLFPFSTSMEVPLNSKPGVVTWHLVITDRNSNQTLTVDGKGKIRPADFGIVQLTTTADREGRVPMPPVGVVGSQVYINFATVGFGRAPGTKQPDIKVGLRVLDESKKPTLNDPLAGHIHADVPDGVRLLPLQFGLTMNRPGRFTIELTARDETTGKSDRVTLPVRILEAD
jgi:hypothetical protein